MNRRHLLKHLITIPTFATYANKLIAGLDNRKNNKSCIMIWWRSLNYRYVGSQA